MKFLCNDFPLVDDITPQALLYQVLCTVSPHNPHIGAPWHLVWQVTITGTCRAMGLTMVSAARAYNTPAPHHTGAWGWAGRADHAAPSSTAAVPGTAHWRHGAAGAHAQARVWLRCGAACHVGPGCAGVVLPYDITACSNGCPSDIHAHPISMSIQCNCTYRLSEQASLHIAIPMAGALHAHPCGGGHVEPARPSGSRPHRRRLC